MKNYLIAIDNEIEQHYKKLINNIKINDSLQFELQVQEFCDNVIAVCDYYVNPVFNNGKMIIDKKLGLLVKKDTFTQQEVDYIKDYKINVLREFSDILKAAIINCYEYRNSDKEFYEQIIEIVISKFIKLFKYAQLSECKNQNITKVNLISDVSISCPVCQTMSNFTHDVNKLIGKIDEFHPFCKLTIEPINIVNTINFTIPKTNIGFINLPINLQDTVKSILTQLKIYLDEKITEKNFIIVNNINNENDFIELLQNEYSDDKILDLQDQIQNSIGLFEIDNKVYISKNYLNKIEYFIVYSLLKEKLSIVNLTWWTEQYYKKQEHKYVGDNVALYTEPFISYIAEQNDKYYFLESAIYYILSPQLLKDTDPDNYNKLNFLRNNIYHSVLLYN
jgi:hypothetical protein